MYLFTSRGGAEQLTMELKSSQFGPWYWWGWRGGCLWVIVIIGAKAVRCSLFLRGGSHLVSVSHLFGESCSFWRTHFSVTHACAQGWDSGEVFGPKKMEESLWPCGLKLSPMAAC